MAPVRMKNQLAYLIASLNKQLEADLAERLRFLIANPTVREAAGKGGVPGFNEDRFTAGEAQIGAILGRSPRTVQKHLEHVYVKLGVENRQQAVELFRGATDL